MCVVQFPQKAVGEYSSLMSLLRCEDCSAEWIALYATGTLLADLYCPYCDSTKVTNRQGAREVFFYDYGE